MAVYVDIAGNVPVVGGVVGIGRIATALVAMSVSVVALAVLIVRKKDTTIAYDGIAWAVSIGIIGSSELIPFVKLIINRCCQSPLLFSSSGVRPLSPASSTDTDQPTSLGQRIRARLPAPFAAAEEAASMPVHDDTPDPLPAVDDGVSSDSSLLSSTPERDEPPAVPVSSGNPAHTGAGWVPRRLAPDVVEQKMQLNLLKAVSEHRIANPADYSLATEDAVIEWYEKPIDAAPLHFSMSEYAAQGIRDTMEDSHFFLEAPKGVLAGVFDGHGGGEVAAYSQSYVKKNFFQVLQAEKGCVHAAFETLLHRLQLEIQAHHAGWKCIGSTAVICYIDKETHSIYTATLGDSEATIYLKALDQAARSIPLSPLRNWRHGKELERLERDIRLITENPSFTIPGDVDPKELRVMRDLYSLNVSRALGDDIFSRTIDGKHPTLLHKPKITMYAMRPGYTVVLACDGVKDYVPEKAIAEIACSFSPSTDAAVEPSVSLAQIIAETALDKYQSDDNVTVLSIQVT